MPIKDLGTVTVNLDPPREELATDDAALLVEIDQHKRAIPTVRAASESHVILKRSLTWLIELWENRQCNLLEKDWGLPLGWTISDRVVGDMAVMVQAYRGMNHARAEGRTAAEALARLHSEIRESFSDEADLKEYRLRDLARAANKQHKLRVPPGIPYTPWGQPIGRTERGSAFHQVALEGGVSRPPASIDILIDNEGNLFDKPACAHAQRTELLFSVVCTDCGEKLT